MRKALLTLLVVVLSVSACSSGSKPPPRPGIDGLQTFTEEPKERHTTGHVTYDHTPPAGGMHWPPSAEGVYGWLRCGVYTEPVPNEFAVHSEEHGAVWLTYQPGYSSVGLLAAMSQLNPEYVLVSPYPGQDSPVIATTWGLQLKVQSADDRRLVQFIQAYAGGNQGGEKGATCATKGFTPEQARAYDAQK